MDFLTVVTPEGASLRRDLDGETLSIGCASGNDLVPEDLNVSRNHAAVVRRTEGVYRARLAARTAPSSTTGGLPSRCAWGPATACGSD